MSTLEIKDLHVTVDTEEGAKEILRGVDPDRPLRRDARHHGPQRLRQVDAGLLDRGPPQVHRHLRHRHPRRRGRARDEGRRARPRRPLPRDAVPRRGPRRHRLQLPAHRQDRDRRRGPQAAHLGQGHEGRHGAPAHGPRLRRAQRQRGLLRRREEAPRDPPDGAAAARSSPILDETDSGLDVDALRVVSEGVNRAKETSGVGVLLITHYTRILRYIEPDFVHVFVDGRIVEEGGKELADRLEAEGYDRFLPRPRPSRPRAGCRHLHRRGAGPHPGRLPDPVAHRARRASAGLPRLGGDLAQAAPGARRRARLLRAAQRRRAPGRAPARRGGHRRLRVRPRHDRRFIGARRRRGRLHQERHRGDQPRRLRVHQRRATAAAAGTATGSRSVPATRSSSPRWSTTPTSCRGRSAASAPARRCAGCR